MPHAEGAPEVAAEQASYTQRSDGILEPGAPGRRKRRAAVKSRKMITQYATDSYEADELQLHNSNDGSSSRRTNTSTPSAAAAAAGRAGRASRSRQSGSEDSNWEEGGDDSDDSQGG